MTVQQARTPVEEAFTALHEHSLSCPQCKPVWVGDEPEFGKCPAADRLYREWRQRSRERRQI